MQRFTLAQQRSLDQVTAGNFPPCLFLFPGVLKKRAEIMALFLLLLSLLQTWLSFPSWLSLFHTLRGCWGGQSELGASSHFLFRIAESAGLASLKL